MIARTFSLVVASALVAGANPFSLPDGGSGFKLLKTPTTPRSQALSGAGAARPGLDPASNPALDSADRMELAAGWVQSYAKFEGSYQEADWISPAGSWTWTARARYGGFGEIPGRDESDLSTGTYAASSWSAEAGLTVPVERIRGLRVGLLGGGGSESVSDASEVAAWISGGLSWAPPDHPWSVGLSVENLGRTGGSDRLAAVVQAGFAWTAHLGDWTVIPLADVRQVADEDLVFPVGVELAWNGVVFRSGFPIGRTEARPSFGMGYRGDSWGVDAGLGWHAALGLAPSGRLSVLF